jgi:hypothetical protein
MSERRASSMNGITKVGKIFRQWQSEHGRGTGYHIPEEMKKRAVQLLEGYTEEAVTRELRLGHGTLRSWKLKSERLQVVREKRRSAAAAKKPFEFIEVKKPIEVDPAGPTIEWERADGCRLRLTGSPPAELSNFINEFLGSGGGR